MNKKIKLLYLLLGTCFALGLSVFFWKIINFNYNFSEEIKGYYLENNLSHQNNLIKFATVVSFSVLTFFLLLKNIYYKNIKILNLNGHFIGDTSRSNNISKIIVVIFLFIILINYLSRDLIVYKIDYFHEGLTLSYALNYLSTKEIWVNSYLSNSIFSDIFSAVIPWIFLDNISVGSYRVFHDFLRFITEIFVIFFIYKLSFVYNLKKKEHNIFLILLLFFSISLNRDLTETFYPFRYRDIPIFIMLILSINFLKFDKNLYITPTLIGFLSFLSLFWSLDRGIYFIVAIIFLFMLAMLKKRYLAASLLLIGFSTSLLLSIILFGSTEIKDFYINTLNVVKYFDLYAGSSYPTVFDLKNSHSSRGSINLFIIIVNGFLLSLFLLKSNLRLTENSKIYFIFFYFISILMYKGALSVPDSYHMKQSIFLSKILLVSHILYLFLKSKYISTNFYLSIIAIVLVFFISIKNFTTFDLYNIKNFKKINYDYIKLSDDNFFDESYLNLKKLILKNYNINCIQIFSYDAIVPYLTKKKSCTKFNFLYLVSSQNIQKRMIYELSKKSPEIILFNRKYEFLNLIPVEKKIVNVFNYIELNYYKDRDYKNWTIYKRK